jgi:hypothetical protein
VIHVGGVDEVHTLIERLVDNPARGGFIGFSAEHHRAQAEGRNLEGASTQISVVHHDLSMQGLACGCRGAACLIEVAPVRR